MLDDSEILNLVGNELNQSVGGNENGFITGNREASLSAYLGNPDGKEVEGRSSVVSTDVADAIEWIMPEIVKSFTQNNEVVVFDPVSDGDEDQAELESQFVYDILMKENNGFIVLHQFIKDALMQKNGFIKVTYQENREESTESYTGLNEVELNMILASPQAELLEQTEYTDETGSIPLFDVKIKIVRDNSKVCVDSVPPEEFRVNRLHNSVDVSKARFTAQVFLKTAGDLVEQGYPKELVDEIPTSEVYDHDREYRFYVQGESVGLEDEPAIDPSMRPIEVAECYLKADLDEDGIAEFMKIDVAGGDNPTHVLEMTPIDSNPFISSTAILMSHKLFGLSIYDRLKQIQDQKTALWRNILDNMYLQNNQRTVVVESQVNIDDLLVSRPGGIVRAKHRDAVAPLVTPQLDQGAYKMMDYLDMVRAGRAGVSPEGAVTDNMIGDRVGSEGVDRMMNQKEELVGLMIRVIAETGIKPLCYKIREEAMKHQDVLMDYKFRGTWVQTNPTHWDKRTSCTVRVGTGSGNRKEQIQALTYIMAGQEKMLANPSQSLVTEEQVFSAFNDFAKFSNMPGARKYILDPKSPEGQQNKQQVQQANAQAQQAEMQEKQMLAETSAKIAEAEVQKAQATMANVQLKAQIDEQKNQIAAQKQIHDVEVAILKQKLEEAKVVVDGNQDNQDLRFKYHELDEKLQVERERIRATAQAAADNNKAESNE